MKIQITIRSVLFLQRMSKCSTLEYPLLKPVINLSNKSRRTLINPKSLGALFLCTLLTKFPAIIGTTVTEEIKEAIKEKTTDSAKSIKTSFTRPLAKTKGTKITIVVKVEAKTERNKNPLIILESIDKQLLGQVCAKIRTFRKPEPYKGKGIKFVGEVIRRKSGKSAAAK